MRRPFRDRRAVPWAILEYVGRELRARGMNSSNDELQAGADLRKKYETPALLVFGTLAELTRKNGGPGNDNPGQRQSLP